MVSRCVGPDSAPSPQPDVFRPLSFKDGAIVLRRPFIVVHVPHRFLLSQLSGEGSYLWQKAELTKAVTQNGICC